jgi:hypothetical protein
MVVSTLLCYCHKKCSNKQFTDDEEEGTSKATSVQGTNSPNILRPGRDPDLVVVTGAPPRRSEESEPERSAAAQRSPLVGHSIVSSATEASAAEISNRATSYTGPLFRRNLTF